MKKLLLVAAALVVSSVASAGIKLNEAAIDYFLRTHILKVDCGSLPVSIHQNSAEIDGKAYGFLAEPNGVNAPSFELVVLQAGNAVQFLTCTTPSTFDPKAYEIRYERVTNWPL